MKKANHFTKSNLRILLLTFLVFGNVFPQKDTIVATVDLKNIQNDKVKVILNFSQDTNSSTKQVYYLPYTIPGSYDNLKYSKYINNFQLYGSDNKKHSLFFGDEKLTVLKKHGLDKLEEERIKELFVFPESTQRIEYTVGDAYDIGENLYKNFVPEACIFNKDKLFQINWGAVLGTFNSYTDNVYKIKVIKPKNLYGATTLDKTIINDTLEVIYAHKYSDLIDQPTFYTGSDTTSFKVNSSTFEVVVFSENNNMYSKKVANKLQPVIEIACNSYLEGIAPKKYIFMYYLTSGFGMGALEHKTSSIYFLGTTDTLVSSGLMITSAHEVLHILTPLTVSSSEIGHFDSNFPPASKHLWMYEGVTEYFSQLLLMETSPDYLAYFLKTIARNNRDAKKNFSMTKMSENIYKKRWSKKFNNVYTKGALTAFALDIEIYTLTDGKMRLYDVMMELKRHYNDKYFSDNELIDEIIEIVGDSKISTFFNRYVSGRRALPLKKYLNQIGYEIKIIKEENDELWNGFNNRISYKGTRVFIKCPSKELYGKLKCGRKIEVISINGKKNVYANRFKLFDLKEGEYIEYLCNGKTEKIVIKTKNRKRKYLLKKVIKVTESNAKQKELFREITNTEW